MKAAYLTAAFAAVLLAGALFTGHSSAEGNEDRAVPQEATRLATATNSFGVDLFKRLHEDGENTFISPTSIATAMQLAALGARSETLAEMERAMNIEGLDLRQANRALYQELTSRDGVTLTVANSVWGDPNRVTFRDEFIRDARTYFDSEGRLADFNDPKTVDIINNWISDKTNRLINKMLDGIDPNEVAFLINAIYFKGDWTVPFDKDKTEEADFHLAGGDTKRLNLMSRQGQMHYLERDGHQIVRLSYGKDRQSAMWIALPDKEKGLDGLVKELSADELQDWRSSAGRRQGTLKLPRFQMRYSQELSEALMAQGIKRAFGNADFTGMGSSPLGPLYISGVLHEAVVKVNEEGTEAAAATVVRMGATRATRPQPFRMICDRPFLFFITDEPTGAILFMGAVHQPEDFE
jgi:serine protease inhibitor